jgi:integrase
MSLYRRNGWYYADFTINGQRFRQALETKDHREASRKEKELIGQAGLGRLSTSSNGIARLAFGEAADRYLASRRLELAPGSQAKEKQLLVKLREFFKATPLRRIGTEEVKDYREWRFQQGVGPAIINMEVGCVRRILKRAKRWHLIADDIKPLREPESIGRVLTLEEKLRLLKVASQKPEWQTAYWAATMALNTTMCGGELRGLRWSDVNLIDRTSMVYKGKTKARARVIPLVQEAYETLLKIRKRAEAFGPVEPSHYVFAAIHPRGRFQGSQPMEMRATGFDPTRPIGSWRTAWRTITKGRACRVCGFTICVTKRLLNWQSRGQAKRQSWRLQAMFRGADAAPLQSRPAGGQKASTGGALKALVADCGHRRP